MPIALIYLLIYVGIVSAFNLAYLTVCDLFPNIFLATAFGACNVSGRFVTIAAPVIAYAPRPIPILTLISFSGLCIVLPLYLIKVNQHMQSLS